MANGDGPQGILGMLGMQNQQPQGLLGALGDPETMAYIGMMLKGMNPYSQIDPNAMLSAAHANALKKQALMQAQAERATDNARADEALGLRRQEYGDARTERQAREAERLGIKREQLEQKERERKANADAMRILGLPPSAPEGAPGPQSSYDPSAYDSSAGSPEVVAAPYVSSTPPPEMVAAPYTSGDQAPPFVTPAADGFAGSEGQAGRTTGPSRDETLRAQNEKLQAAILANDKLAPATLNAINKKIEQNEAMMGTPDWVTTPEMAKKYHESTVAERVTAERAKPARENIYRGTINAANDALKMLEQESQETNPVSTVLGGMGVSRYAGLPAWVAKKYPGASPASEFGEKLETIKSGTQIDTMLALKQASSTGATGLGSLTEKEGEILQKIQGSLSQERQSAESLRRNITRAKNFAEAMKAGITITEENEDKILNKGLEKSEPRKGNATRDALIDKYRLEK